MNGKQRFKERGFTLLETLNTKGNHKKSKSLTGFTPLDSKRLTGFTLIEMMVSLGIFTIVLSVSVGALLSMVSSNRKTQSLRSAMDNLNLAMEEMSRNIIQGRKYHCGEYVFSGPFAGIEVPRDCPSGSIDLSGDSTFLALEAHDGVLTNPNDQIVYKLDPIKKRLQKSTNSGSSFDYVTAPSIEIDNLKFYVSGNGADDEVPRVVITVSGIAGTKEGTQSSFNIQTMATQRAPE